MPSTNHKPRNKLSFSVLRPYIADTIRCVFLLGLLASALSRYITGNWHWSYFTPTPEPWKSNWPPNYVFSEPELARYGGEDASLPLLLAIDGSVYDVSAGRRMYGPGGSYSMMAGRDAARAFVTGCFKDHLTHDTRGLTEAQLKSLDSWTSFYEKSDKYHKVGRVNHPPIDPAAPFPADCKKGASQPNLDKPKAPLPIATSQAKEL